MSSYFWTIQVPVIVKDILYLTAVLNSCMNPIIYGVENENEKSKKMGFEEGLPLLERKRK